MKVKNKHVYSPDQEWLKTLKEEYTALGFDTDLDTAHLTVYTIRRKKPKSTDDKAKPIRNKRAESHAR